jgi:hypothetical protein
MDYPEIPGWYEPGTETEIEEYEERDFKEKQILPVRDVVQHEMGSYRTIFEEFYRRNYLIISFIQFLIIVILLIKILKSK